MNTKKWTTKEGAKIRIKDMTDSHLINTIRMLEKYASQIENSCPCSGDKDWCWCFKGNVPVEPEQMEPLYLDLEKEAVKRGLMASKESEDDN